MLLQDSPPGESSGRGASGCSLGRGHSLPRASPAAASQVRQREWWLGALHITGAWRVSGGAGVTVALLDTGVYPAAPDLRGQVTAGPDFTQSGRDGSGPYWGLHGTAMATLIAGHGHGPGDSEGIMGVAPQARILSVRVILESGDPLRADPVVASLQPAAIAAGIRYAAAHGAQVIDLPLAPRGAAAAAGRQAEQAAVTYALAKGVVLVAPAGDDGIGADLISYPAAYPGVISVGAFNRNFIKASFSSHRPFVTMTAAGVGMVAGTPSGGYAVISSTSAASAVVTGMAALIKSRYRAFTPAEVSEALTQSTVFRPRGGKSGGSGSGTADATGALLFAARMKPVALPEASQPGRYSAAGAGEPLVPASGDSLRATLLNDGIRIFLALLVLLLALSLFAVLRLPAAPAGPAEQDADEPPGSLPPAMSSPSTGLPRRFAAAPPGEPAADRATPPARVQGYPPDPGYRARPATGQAPGQGTVRPPQVLAGPPWGPAPKPEGEPP